MPPRTLRDIFKHLVLSAPLVAGACSGPNGGGGMPFHETFLIGDGGVFTDAGLDCTVFCEQQQGGFVSVVSCQLTSVDGGPAVDCLFQSTGGLTGRRPWSLLPRGASGAAHAVGALFAEAACLERASVDAFDILARELRDHGAPSALEQASRRAAADEVRHAKVTAALARRYRAAPLAPSLKAVPGTRGLEALALENAVEGCVRETFGALLASWQAAHATDRRIAAAMTQIAEDETRHAELGLAVAAWAQPKLGAAARLRVREARTAALEALVTEQARPVAAPLVALAGVPPSEIAIQLAGGLRRALAA